MAKRAKAAEAAVITPDPAVWEAALALAGGDHRRLCVTPAGAVMVGNHANGKASRVVREPPPAPPYSQQALDAAAAELGRQLHGGPADPHDIKLASDVLSAAFSVGTVA
jgi:hypothetical protein